MVKPFTLSCWFTDFLGGFQALEFTRLFLRAVLGSEQNGAESTISMYPISAPNADSPSVHIPRQSGTVVADESPLMRLYHPKSTVDTKAHS